MISRLISTLLVFYFLSFGAAHAEDKITVGTIDRAPFSFTNKQGERTGFSVELWEQISKQTNLNYVWKNYEKFSDMINDAKNNKIALSTANISITAAREAHSDFSHPIFSSGMSIAIKKGAKQSLFSLIWDSGILLFLGGALVLLLIIAHIVWFFERNTEDGRHDYFRADYFGGVWDAFWWAFIIMTMGGFENEVPQKKLNRVIAIFWIITSLFFISTLTAKITTALTVAELKTGIESYQDLAHKRVGVTEGSSHQKFLKKHNINTIAYTTLDQLYADLKNDKLDAIVADYPILSYYIKNNSSDWMMLAGEVFNRENLGIIFPENSPYLEAVNKALLVLREDGEYEKLQNKYFGDSN